MVTKVEIDADVHKANMALDKITPNDERLEHKFATVKGHRWRECDPCPRHNTSVF